MPCYYTGSAEGDAQLAHDADHKKLTEIITGLTQHLCALCQHCEDKGLEIKPARVAKWWEKHKEVDKRRKT